MHVLLARQLRKFFKDSEIPKEMEGFLESINNAYNQFDDDRLMLERSLELSSQELLQVNSELRSLFSALDDILIVLDKNGFVLKLIETNASKRKEFFGFTIGKNTSEIFKSDPNLNILEKINLAFETGIPTTSECMFEYDGKNFVFQILFSPLSVEKIMMIIRDITKKKEAEFAIIESEKKYREVIENATDIIFTINRSGKFLYANRAALVSSGYSIEELQKVTYLDLILPSFRNSVQRTYHRQFLQAKNTTYLEFPFWDKNKTVKWFAQNATLIVESGRIIGFQVIARDITDRRKAEAQVNDLVNLIDHARDAIIVAHDDGKIVYWNRSAERLYGWNSSEAKNMQLRDLVHEKSRSRFFLAEKEIIQNGEWVGEIYQKTKFLKEIIVESRWTLQLNTGNGSKSILCINTDVTDKKNIEIQLLRSQRLDSLGKLASGIAHDLNNVLAPIMVSIELLLRKITDPNQVRLIKSLESAAERGKDIVKQVLTFSRGFGGEKTNIQPGQIISEIEKITKDTFSKNVIVSFEEEKSNLSIEADPTQIQQVLLNLIVNAKDALISGGRIKVKLHSFLVDENFANNNIDAKLGSYIVFSVSDSGSGISVEILDKIFEPFFTTKEIGKGTGLGLSTAISIVKSHGGFITVHSELGVGTEFKVYLPAFSEFRPVQVSKNENEFWGNGELILLIDDEKAILSIVQDILESKGYKVVTANNGREGIDIFKKFNEKISLVITDIMMPHGDGISFIRHLRNDDQDIRIIGSSGLGYDSYSKELKNLQIDTFLQKPYSANALLKAVNSSLNKSMS